MAYGKRDGFSYADDVPIKISERVKIPARVMLPVSFNPCISLDLLEEYDFTLEKQVLEMCEARKRAKEVREKEKAEKIARDIEQFTQTNHNIKSDDKSDTKDGNLVKTEDKLVPKGWQTTQILSPVPLVNKEKILKETNESSKKAINLEDFENQGGSPFDFMELQTINEIEELSNVFRGIGVEEKIVERDPPVNNSSNITNTSTNYPPVEPSVVTLTNDTANYSMTKTYNNPENHLTNNYYPYDNGQNSLQYSLQQYNMSSAQVIDFPRLRGSKSTPDISVDREDSVIARAKACLSWRSQTPPPTQLGQASMMDIACGYSSSLLPSTNTYNNHFATTTTTKESRQTETKTKEKKLYLLPDPFDELETEQRQFVMSLIDMGFPRDRAARAVKHLGMDDKKVVDHLCQVEALIENGVDSNDAETALHLYDYNIEEAKKFLDLLVQFQDLGFDKDSARKALIRHKNDRDKALDSLLS